MIETSTRRPFLGAAAALLLRYDADDPGHAHAGSRIILRAFIELLRYAFVRERRLSLQQWRNSQSERPHQRAAEWTKRRLLNEATPHLAARGDVVLTAGDGGFDLAKPLSSSRQIALVSSKARTSPLMEAEPPPNSLASEGWLPLRET